MQKVIYGKTYSVIVPKRPKDGCPDNSYGCSGYDCNMKQSCFCEEHCSWETCRLVDYPEECIEDLESIWRWDTEKLFWVAQVHGMAYKCYFIVDT